MQGVLKADSACGCSNDPDKKAPPNSVPPHTYARMLMRNVKYKGEAFGSCSWGDDRRHPDPSHRLLFRLLERLASMTGL